MSQLAMAQRLNISYQQVQKYETGAIRVGASLIARIADILQKPPGWFFDAVDKPEIDVEQHILDRFAASPDGVRLARAFQAIGNKAIRSAILACIEEIAQTRKGDQVGEPPRFKPAANRQNTPLK